jgi:small-conductance mechanosensitive channel
VNIRLSSIVATLPNPLFLAVVVVVIGFLSTRIWRSSSSPVRFLHRLLAFAVVTGLMLAGGVVPYRQGLGNGGESKRLLVGALEVFWWLGAAWLAVGFLRAFLVLEGQPRESKLFQDLLAAVIYLAAAFAIVAEVFDLPVRGLLATSGALAIILGLALPSSVGDVFSGIVSEH